MRNAEIFPDVPTGSERDEILKQSRKTRAKYVRSSDKDTESEDERVENVPQLSEFPGKSSTKNIETNEKKKGSTEYYKIIDKLSSLNLLVTDLIGGQKKILEKFECISEQINRQPQSPEEVETIDIWYNLPLKDEVALQELEDKLKEDDKYRKKLVKELANIGDRDTKNLTSKIMRHTFTNELAVHYSWIGTEEKKPFRDLMICKVIFAALRKHHDQNFTEEKMLAPIKTWLANAKKRCSKAPLNAQN
ncbi:unnamed protein product [Lasius platythorax]|uniref:DUF4806 domain-containing protein n=1 Tax=Lasius platythorax TaxID=488582 RepID=A0AAV2NZI2_9HYME